MQKAFILLLALLLISHSFAYDPDAERQMRLFSSMVLPENSTFYSENFSSGNATAYLVFHAGKAYSLFLQNASQLIPISNVSEIQSALNDYYLSLGIIPISLSDFEPAHAGVVEISDNYQKGENDCRRLTGTDRNPCKDFFSCQQACYAVTSFCLPVALGSGATFINIIWDFENDSDSLDFAYAEEAKAYAALRQNTTRENVELYLAALERINRAATNASLSPLYDAYSYCFLPDYALDDITSIQLSAQRHYVRSLPLFSIQQAAEEIANITCAALEKKKASEDAVAAAQAEIKAQEAAKKKAEETAMQKAGEERKNQELQMFTLAGAAFFICAAVAIYLFVHRKKRET